MCVAMSATDWRQIQFLKTVDSFWIFQRFLHFLHHRQSMVKHSTRILYTEFYLLLFTLNHDGCLYNLVSTNLVTSWQNWWQHYVIFSVHVLKNMIVNKKKSISVWANLTRRQTENVLLCVRFHRLHESKYLTLSWFCHLLKSS